MKKKCRKESDPTNNDSEFERIILSKSVEVDVIQNSKSFYVESGSFRHQFKIEMAGLPLKKSNLKNKKRTCKSGLPILNQLIDTLASFTPISMNEI